MNAEIETKENKEKSKSNDRKKRTASVNNVANSLRRTHNSEKGSTQQAKTTAKKKEPKPQSSGKKFSVKNMKSDNLKNDDKIKKVSQQEKSPNKKSIPLRQLAKPRKKRAKKPTCEFFNALSIPVPQHELDEEDAASGSSLQNHENLETQMASEEVITNPSELTLIQRNQSENEIDLKHKILLSSSNELLVNAQNDGGSTTMMNVIDYNFNPENYEKPYDPLPPMPKRRIRQGGRKVARKTTFASLEMLSAPITRFESDSESEGLIRYYEDFDDTEQIQNNEHSLEKEMDANITDHGTSTSDKEKNIVTCNKEYSVKLSSLARVDIDTVQDTKRKIISEKPFINSNNTASEEEEGYALYQKDPKKTHQSNKSSSTVSEAGQKLQSESEHFKLSNDENHMSQETLEEIQLRQESKEQLKVPPNKNFISILERYFDEKNKKNSKQEMQGENTSTKKTKDFTLTKCTLSTLSKNMHETNEVSTAKSVAGTKFQSKSLHKLNKEQEKQNIQKDLKKPRKAPKVIDMITVTKPSSKDKNINSSNVESVKDCEDKILHKTIDINSTKITPAKISYVNKNPSNVSSANNMDEKYLSNEAQHLKVNKDRQEKALEDQDLHKELKVLGNAHSENNLLAKITRSSKGISIDASKKESTKDFNKIENIDKNKASFSKLSKHTDTVDRASATKSIVEKNISNEPQNLKLINGQKEKSPREQNIENEPRKVSSESGNIFESNSEAIEDDKEKDIDNSNFARIEDLNSTKSHLINHSKDTYQMNKSLSTLNIVEKHLVKQSQHLKVSYDSKGMSIKNQNASNLSEDTKKLLKITENSNWKTKTAKSSKELNINASVRESGKDYDPKNSGKKVVVNLTINPPSNLSKDIDELNNALPTQNMAEKKFQRESKVSELNNDKKENDQKKQRDIEMYEVPIKPYAASKNNNSKPKVEHSSKEISKRDSKRVRENEMDQKNAKETEGRNLEKTNLSSKKSPIKESSSQDAYDSDDEPLIMLLNKKKPFITETSDETASKSVNKTTNTSKNSKNNTPKKSKAFIPLVPTPTRRIGKPNKEGEQTGKSYFVPMEPVSITQYESDAESKSLISNHESEKRHKIGSREKEKNTLINKSGSKEYNISLSFLEGIDVDTKKHAKRKIVSITQEVNTEESLQSIDNVESGITEEEPIFANLEVGSDSLSRGVNHRLSHLPKLREKISTHGEEILEENKVNEKDIVHETKKKDSEHVKKTKPRRKSATKEDKRGVDAENGDGEESKTVSKEPSYTLDGNTATTKKRKSSARSKGKAGVDENNKSTSIEAETSKEDKNNEEQSKKKTTRKRKSAIKVVRKPRERKNQKTKQGEDKEQGEETKQNEENNEENTANENQIVPVKEPEPWDIKPEYNIPETTEPPLLQFCWKYKPGPDDAPPIKRRVTTLNNPNFQPDGLGEKEQEEEIPSDSGPQVQIVNGEIVMNEESLYLHQHKTTDEIEAECTDVVVEDSTMINAKYDSFLTKPRTRQIKWGAEDTYKFYMSLRKHGTDLSMMEDYFKNKYTRRELSLKLKKENNRNARLVDLALYHGRRKRNADRTNRLDFVPFTLRIVEEEKEESKENTAEEKVKEEDVEVEPEKNLTMEDKYASFFEEEEQNVVYEDENFDDPVHKVVSQSQDYDESKNVGDNDTFTLQQAVVDDVNNSNPPKQEESQATSLSILGAASSTKKKKPKKFKAPVKKKK